MSDLLRGVVLTHAGLSDSLLQAVREITGDDEALVAVSNCGLGMEGICETVMQSIQGSPTVVFVDLPGGSCFHAILTAARDRDDVALVTGVNLPMLLDFVFNRDTTAARAAERAATIGGKAIRVLGT